MRILKYGKVKPEKVMCPHCEALLEYTNTDLDYTSLACHFDEEKTGLRCPVCDRIMTLELYRDGIHYMRKEDGKMHIVDTYQE